MNMIRFMGMNRDTTTAGPGKRLEFFTKGCIRGVISPCEGCFNESTWTFEGQYRGMTVDEVVEICDTTAWNRQVTFCGGEPILQARALTEVAKRLKEIDPTFHFVMYTAYKLDTLIKHGLKFTWVKEKHGLGMYDALMNYSAKASVKEVDEVELCSNKIEFTILTPEDVHELMKYINIIVDGDYKHDLRIPTDKYMNEGQFIGSSNQRVIDCKKTLKKGELSYMSPDAFNRKSSHTITCQCCGHALGFNRKDYCNNTCYRRYNNRAEEMKLLGGI